MYKKIKIKNQTTEPATYVLPNWKTQNRCRCWEGKCELCNIMAQLWTLNKFELFKVLRVQDTYKHVEDMN